MLFTRTQKRRWSTRKGGSQMFSLKNISLKKIALVISLMAMLGIASCEAHVGGSVGGHGGEVGGAVGK